jgi:hypothetical protein
LEEKYLGTRIENLEEKPLIRIVDEKKEVNEKKPKKKKKSRKDEDKSCICIIE